jgi:hypothetical protein
MKGIGSKLPRKKEEAIAALLTHSTFQAAADSVGIGVATLWRWSRDQCFQESYREARRKIVEQAVAQIQNAMTEAVRTLRDVMAESGATASARVSAAKAVLDLGLRGVELEDLMERVEKLERNLPHNLQVT